MQDKFVAQIEDRLRPIAYRKLHIHEITVSIQAPFFWGEDQISLGQKIKQIVNILYELPWMPHVHLAQSVFIVARQLLWIHPGGFMLADGEEGCIEKSRIRMKKAGLSRANKILFIWIVKCIDVISAHGDFAYPLTLPPASG
ncbi:hypothetical protein N7540_011556 [Penicillium herquei]|nr:hypothetical protein N7540_011556 [Penicillium herquei]